MLDRQHGKEYYRRNRREKSERRRAPASAKAAEYNRKYRRCRLKYDAHNERKLYNKMAIRAGILLLTWRSLDFVRRFVNNAAVDVEARNFALLENMNILD